MTAQTTANQFTEKQVTEKQLNKYAELIYEVTGIRIASHKRALLSNRLRRRLRQTGISDFDAYYDHLKSINMRDPEWDYFLQEITTHETYLFRDEVHWNWMREEYLPELSAASKKGRAKNLRVWSAACSTGAEAYTVATCVFDALPDYASWGIEIYGTDIGIGAVEEARTAHFSERDVKLVPDLLRKRCFRQGKEQKHWEPIDALRKMCKFDQHNLLDPLRQRQFDLVILKNVLIYFDNASKEVVVRNILAAIKPGGMLIAGAAEGVSGMLGEMTRVRPWLFTKG